MICARRGGKLAESGPPVTMEKTMKHLVYALAAVSAVALSAGAFACEGRHTASTDSKIVVAQQQAQGSGQQAQGASAGQSK